MRIEQIQYRIGNKEDDDLVVSFDRMRNGFDFCIQNNGKTITLNVEQTNELKEIINKIDQF